MRFQNALSGRSIDYINADGLLNTQKLLKQFTQFYRENSVIWLEKFDYKESGPHLILLAFLQRVINGGGTIHREYALGKKRVDLLICWPGKQPKQRIVIELKLWNGPQSLSKGLEQTAEYMDLNNATEGHLIIFDKRDISWDEKIYQKTEVVGTKTIHVWGM